MTRDYYWGRREGVYQQLKIISFLSDDFNISEEVCRQGET